MLLEPAKLTPAVADMISPGMDEVLAMTRGEFTKEAIMDAIASGALRLWIAVDDGRYAGYAVTKLDTFPTGRQLTVLQVWKSPEASGALDDLLPILEAEAVACGCRWVAAYSKVSKNRAGQDWQDRLAKLGFRPGYTEFSKEI